MPHIKIKDKVINDLVKERGSSTVELITRQKESAHPPRQGILIPQELVHPSVLQTLFEERLNAVVRNWVEEFACDVIGMCLFGPAFLLSHLHFFIPLQELDDAHDTHPSPRMRFKFCLNSMLGTDTGLGYRQVTSVPLEKELAPWKRKMLEKIPKAQDKILQLAYESVRPVLPRILSICKRETSELIYDIKCFDNDIPNLCKRFSQALPPNEYYDDTRKEIVPADMISILNAAWIFHLGWLVPEPNLMASLKSERKQRFLGLIQKAIEMMELKQAWVHEHKDGNIKPQTN